jgi:hypothetical protein
MGGIDADTIGMAGALAIGLVIAIGAMAAGTMIRLRQMRMDEAERVRRHQAEADARMLGLCEPTHDNGVSLRLEALEQDMAEVRRALTTLVGRQEAARAAEPVQAGAAIGSAPRIAAPPAPQSAVAADQHQQVDA